MIAESENRNTARKGGVIVCTGADSHHITILQDLVSSLVHVRDGKFDIGVVRFQHEDLRLQYTDDNVYVRDVFSNRPFSSVSGYFAAQQKVKSSLPDLYPGYDNYIWIDADCWVQNNEFVDALIHGAKLADICVHPECDVHYTHFQSPSERTVYLYRSLYGKEMNKLTLYPMINSGVFCAQRISNLWKIWDAELERLIQAHRGDANVRYSDQIPLHKLLYSGDLTFYPLRPVFNWQAYACRPLLVLSRRALVVPTPPNEIISVIHLAGASKNERLTLPQLAYDFTLRYRDIQRVIADLSPT